MSIWPKYPTLYEINTWVWLSGLSRRYGKPLDLSSVPASEWDAIASYGFDAVWLMGVWERSPAGIAIANQNSALRDEFLKALPDFRIEDNVGSPYCVRRYVVDPHLGGSEGLTAARRELSKRNIKLILDFVPNHVAPDHPWVTEHPEYLIHGTTEDLSNDASSFIEIDNQIFACGRDPYCPAWTDVLQLNAFNPGLRNSAIETCSKIAEQCDGIRCDMAMLLLNTIFERTWESRVGSPPSTEYWTDLISAIKANHRHFLFIAEAYWNLEWELQQLGFDFCYDKRLYDRLEHDTTENIRLHLSADLAYQNGLVRFLENHDEPRAATSFSSTTRQKAAAVTIATLPGMKMFHEGQFEGRKVKLPVFLGRRPAEPKDSDLEIFYARLLQTTNRPAFREGNWRLCERSGWPDNTSFQNLIAWSWEKNSDRYLVVVNLSDSSAQAQIQVPWTTGQEITWCLTDLFSGAKYERSVDEFAARGLYVELGPWSFHFFEFVGSGTSNCQFRNAI